MNELLKKLRIENNLTQKEVADYLDVDQSLIAKIENGERNIQTSQIEKLSDLYGYDILNDKKKDAIKIAFRAGNISSDLDSIAKIKRIALNLMFMEDIKNGK